MPLYEYQCENCGDVFEVMQKFSDEPLSTHAKCGGKVHRLLSAPALQFKGHGWYVNDYAKGADSAKVADSGNGAAQKGDAGGPASKSESGGSASKGDAPAAASSSSEAKTKTDSSSDKK